MRFFSKDLFLLLAIRTNLNKPLVKVEKFRNILIISNLSSLEITGEH